MKKIKRTLFNTPIMQAANVSVLAKDALKYIITNKNTIVLGDIAKKQLIDIKSMSTSPMYQMYSRIIDENSLTNFTLLNLINQNDAIPEILTRRDVYLDIKYLDNSSSTVPKDLRNTWLNLTPIISKTLSNKGVTAITDNMTFYSMIVKSYLTMSYHDTDEWLNSKLVMFIIESYSMVLTRLLQRSYNLNPEEFYLVQTIFAYHYAYQLTNRVIKTGDMEVPALLSRAGFLGNIGDIMARVELMAPHLPTNGKLEFRDMIEILKTIGPARMATMKVENIYRLFSSGTTESTSMLVTTDFPPYWCHVLLKMASGIKNPMIHSIFKSTNLSKKLDMFVRELMITKTLKLNR